MQKSSCYISNNDVINISCKSELFNNMDYDVNKLSHTTHVENPRNEVSLISKIAKWAINENITLSALKNLLSIIREIPGCNNVEEIRERFQKHLVT